MKKIRPTILAVTVAGLMASATVSAVEFMTVYRIKPVADTQGGFPYTNVAAIAAMNSSGRVAYDAVLTGGVMGVFTRLGTGGVDTLSDTATSGFGDYGVGQSINSLDTVAFTALTFKPEETVVTILRGSGNSATKLLSSASNDPNHLTDFCGLQINNEGKVAFRAKRSDGKQEIRTHGAGPLTGVFRTIAVEGPVWSNLGCRPSLAHNGNVAFSARRDGVLAIWSVDPNGQVTRVADNTSLFSSFDGIALTQTGGIAFSATLGGGGQGIYRIKDGFLTTLMDTYQPNAPGTPFGVSLNESGKVAYGLLHPNFGGSSVYVGPDSVFKRVVGAGTFVQNRMVRDARIGRDSLNNVGHIAVSLSFFDGTSMVARAEPVRVIDINRYTGAFVLTAVSDGNLSAGTPLPTPPKGAQLTFDLTFMSLGGSVDVRLGGRALQTIRATSVGVRQAVSVPLDPKLATGGLELVLRGGKGSNAQISNIVIPGLSDKPLDESALAKWKFTTERVGTVEVTNAVRYPVKVEVKTVKQDPRRGVTTVAATIYSDEGVDPSQDLLMSSLRLAGTAPRACKPNELNGDKVLDLVCEVELTDAQLKAGTLSLESMTQSGWAIEGSTTVGATKLTR